MEPTELVTRGLDSGLNRFHNQWEDSQLDETTANWQVRMLKSVPASHVLAAAKQSFRSKTAASRSRRPSLKDLGKCLDAPNLRKRRLGFNKPVYLL